MYLSNACTGMQGLHVKTGTFFCQNSDHMNIKSHYIIDGQHETLTETLFIKGEKEIMICEEKYFFLGYI